MPTKTNTRTYTYYDTYQGHDDLDMLPGRGQNLIDTFIWPYNKFDLMCSKTRAKRICKYVHDCRLSTHRANNAPDYMHDIDCNSDISIYNEAFSFWLQTEHNPVITEQLLNPPDYVFALGDQGLKLFIASLKKPFTVESEELPDFKDVMA